MKHVWMKKGTGDDGAKRVRSWSCRRCAASKVVVKVAKSEAPRATIERKVSAERCCA